MSHSLSIRAPMPILGSPQQLLHCQSPWTGLFEYLRDIDWLNLACSPVSLTGNPFALMFRSSTCPVPDLSATPLGLRLMYLESSAQSQRLIRESTTGIATASLLEHSIHILVHKVQREFPRATMMYSFEELARSCREYVRYGSYWDVFRTALQTDEVLLIDPAYSFDNDFPKTTFESAKQIWLCQELGLKQFCQKLSGVSQMISDLARTEKNSEERAFLAAKIPDRIEEVLGPRISPASVHGYPSPFFPADIVASSPVELTDLAMYSPSDSVGGDGSDDGLSLDGSGFQKMLGTDCFNETRLWSS
ncbi:hypothetical protein FQN57_002453 [Myotisia sp. PD_48]|nr:hypothetical protein FQN57_002453 [Myotisia sp. PD_48]